MSSRGCMACKSSRRTSGLDEGEDVGPCGGPVGPDASTELLFNDGEKALRGGVVVAASGPPYSLTQPQLPYKGGESIRGVFRSAVGVDNAAGLQTVWGSESRRCRAGCVSVL